MHSADDMEYVPGTHEALQTLAPDAENLPTLQGKHKSLPDVEYLPAAQGKQAADNEVAYVPAPHEASQTLAPAAEY